MNEYVEPCALLRRADERRAQAAQLRREAEWFRAAQRPDDADFNEGIACLLENVADTLDDLACVLML